MFVFIFFFRIIGVILQTITHCSDKKFVKDLIEHEDSQTIDEAPKLRDTCYKCLEAMFK